MSPDSRDPLEIRDLHEIRELYELRDPGEARQHLLAGLSLVRVGSLSDELLAQVLAWATELASHGSPIPPLGFIADIGLTATGHNSPGSGATPSGDGRPLLFSTPHSSPFTLPISWRGYEDYVLGKLYVDRSFERACDALVRYNPAERVTGVAYLLRRFHERLGSPGAVIGPSVLRALQKAPVRQIAAECRQLAASETPPRLVHEYERLIAAARELGDALDVADVFEIEHRTALAEFGDRLALRQTVLAAEELSRRLPRHKPRAAHRRQQTPSRLHVEDAYPVGGFSSISTRGSIESLLHSQLAYIEDGRRPDLFDVKFLRDELLYYSRDENQFLRRRRTFCFLLHPNLAAARVKDREAPYQRIILTAAFLLAAMRRLVEWLGDESLRFEFLFVGEEAPRETLAPERKLFELILREEIASGLAHVDRLPLETIALRLREAAVRGDVRSLAVSTKETAMEAAAEVKDVPLDRMIVDGTAPRLSVVVEGNIARHETELLDLWSNELQRLLVAWL